MSARFYWRGTNFLEWVDTGVSATVTDFHHLQITTRSTTGESVILSFNQEASTGTNRSFRACDLGIDAFEDWASRYRAAISGAGLKNPLLRNFQIEKVDNGLAGGGLVLTNGTGLECEYLRISTRPTPWTFLAGADLSWSRTAMISQGAVAGMLKWMRAAARCHPGSARQLDPTI